MIPTYVVVRFLNYSVGSLIREQYYLNLERMITKAQYSDLTQIGADVDQGKQSLSVTFNANDRRAYIGRRAWPSSLKV